MELHHISHSQIEKYIMCGHQYKLKYKDGKLEQPANNLILGGSYHFGLEYNFREKLTTGIDAPLDSVLDVYSDYFDAEVEKAKNIASLWLPKSTLKDEGIGLLQCYMKTIAPSVIPIEVELMLEVVIGNTLLQCKIDLIDENFIVIDHKTAAKPYSQDKADDMIQFSAEAFALGRPIECEVHAALKYKNPRVDIVKTNRTIEDIIWWRRLAGNVINGIQADVFPANPNGWWCSATYCGFYQDCKKGTTSYR